MGKISRITFLAVIFGTLLYATTALPQSTNTGEIRGTVTDPSGAVVPGVTVEVHDIHTGVMRKYVTNGAGLYDTFSTPPGDYEITFTKTGFKSLTVGPVVLRVTVITENAKLQVGATTQKVTVVVAGAPLLQTENGQQSEIMTATDMQNLPQLGAGITGNDWSNFAIYLPGASGATQGIAWLGGGAWNAGEAVSINGVLANYGNFLLNGASTTLDAASNNDDAIFETIQEVQVNTSSFSAQYGMGGVVFNQITKSGTNTWHGSLYDYTQNTALNAAGYFNNQAPLMITNPLNPTGPEIPNSAHAVSPLHYDEWGGSVGGPILKNKFFFYFDRDAIIDDTVSTSYETYPTVAMENGDFSGMYPIYDPLSTTGSGATLSRTQFPGNMIPASRMDSVALKFEHSTDGWPTAPQGIGTCAAAPYQNECVDNAFILIPSPSPVLRYFGRLDYDMSAKNRIDFSIMSKNNPGVDNSGPCPEFCGSGDVDAYQTQLSDTWTLAPNMVNIFRFGYTKQGNWFLSDTEGVNPLTAFGLQDTHFDQMPAMDIGGPDAVTGDSPSSDSIYIENIFDPSDMVTLVRGRHILKFGIEVLIDEGNTSAWGSNSAGNYDFTGQYTGGVVNGALNTSTAGSGFADFLLGNVENWSALNEGITGMREKQPNLFIQDDFKVKPNLTVNFGLRWTGNTGMSEEYNRLGDFDQNLINDFGPFAGTAGSLWFAPQDNRSTLQKPDYRTFLPRAGFAWQIRPNTVVRGGAGIFAYNYMMDIYGGEGGAQMGYGAAIEGSNSDPDAAAGDIGWIAAPNTTPLYLDSSATMMANALPYQSASRNPSSYITNPVFSPPYEPYNITPGEIWQWNFSVQHEFAHNFMASISYVGSHATNLQYLTDLNQITNPAELNPSDVSDCNGATPTSIAADPSTCERPYPAFGALSGSNFDAISNYNSLQIVFEKRFSNGLSFNANYAWSHMLDDQDSAGKGGSAGVQEWEYGNNPAANYGNSNVDVPQAFKATAYYDLPVGTGRAFLSHNSALDAVIGGWRVAGAFIIQSGTPFTVLDSGVNNYSQAGDEFASPIPGVSPHSGTCPNGAAVGTLSCWFNSAAFETPAEQGNGVFGSGGRNALLGPDLNNVELSLAKTWTFKERFKFELRADAMNAFNHPSFTLPNNDVSSSGVATITGVSNNSRSIQIGARFSF